jgi:RNA polymerase sigma-70 factor (ECF subfamily)
VDWRPGDATERAQARTAVRDALRGLPDTQREALVLAYWGGLTADEIAQRVQVPLGTAKSRIRLGLAKLRIEPGLLAMT